jgi:hypothetical protein
LAYHLDSSWRASHADNVLIRWIYMHKANWKLALHKTEACKNNWVSVIKQRMWCWCCIFVSLICMAWRKLSGSWGENDYQFLCICIAVSWLYHLAFSNPWIIGHKDILSYIFCYLWTSYIFGYHVVSLGWFINKLPWNLGALSNLLFITLQRKWLIQRIAIGILEHLYATTNRKGRCWASPGD